MMLINGIEYETDKHEYLANYKDWHEAIALHFAQLEGIELTAEHWEIVHFIRDFYEAYETSPAIRVLVKAVAKSFGSEKGNSRYLYQLFPKGPAKQATRIAGLPKPAKCI